MSTSRRLDQLMALAPPGTTPRMVLFAVCVLLPLFTTATALIWTAADGQATKLIADSLPLTVTVTLAGIGALTVGVWYLLDRLMQRQSLAVEASVLVVKSSFYQSRTPLAQIQLEQARSVDLDEHPAFKPSLKTNGYALPGYHSGHFRLKNGCKAFVAIAGERRAVWLPTVDGKGLLLQPLRPDAFLSTLRELAGSAGRR